MIKIYGHKIEHQPQKNILNNDNVIESKQKKIMQFIFQPIKY